MMSFGAAYRTVYTTAMKIIGNPIIFVSAHSLGLVDESEDKHYPISKKQLKNAAESNCGVTEWRISKEEEDTTLYATTDGELTWLGISKWTVWGPFTSKNLPPCELSELSAIEPQLLRSMRLACWDTSEETDLLQFGDDAPTDSELFLAESVEAMAMKAMKAIIDFQKVGWDG